MEKQPTIFFGASSYVLPILDALQDKYDLQLVITTESKPNDVVIAYCQTNNLPYLSVHKLDEQTLANIQKIHAQFAVLADFRLLINQHVLDLFPMGIINIHPSLLPEYRGPTPGTTAILDGKTETGVSLIILDKDLDHGPILGSKTEHILPTDTSVTLYTRLFAKGAELLQEFLPAYLNGTLKPKEQDHGKATFTKFLTRDSGYVALNELEQMDLAKRDRMVRAYFPWPGVWTKMSLGGKEKIVKLLPGKMLQVEGKNPVSPKDFLNGYPQVKEVVEEIL